MSPGGWAQALSAIAALVVVAPLCEEFLFRGLILRGLRAYHGTVTAVGASALLFAFSHYRLPAVILPALAAGLVLGAVAVRTGSIWPPVAVHAAVNAMPLLLPERLIPIKGFNTLQEPVYHIAPAILLGASTAAAAALYGVTRYSRGHPSDDETRPA
jgi:membrane protease YdiL (CAAX protease family)